MNYIQIVCFVLTAIAQLGLGLACGWWLKERRAAPEDNNNSEQFQKVMGRLSELAQTVTDDVDDHSSRMGDIERELQEITPADQDFGGHILAVVERIASVNSLLQSKLASTREQMREQAERLDLHITEARVDVLTELANRRAFNDEMSRRYAELQRTKNPFSLLVVDIDHFKKINDTCGHDGGDRVLKAVAKALRDTVRDMDLAARYGGEEFAVLLPMTDMVRARRAAERAREAVEKLKFEGDLSQARVTVSVGYSQAKADDAPRGLFGRADMALYAAKDAGRNCCKGDDVYGRHGDHDMTDNHAGQETDSKDCHEKTIDVVTGLPNRRHMVEELKIAVSDARATSSGLSLVLLSLDQLDKISECMEAQEVDQLLLRIAATLTANVRDADTVVRYSWEEFAVLLPTVDGEEAALLAAKWRQHLTEELSGISAGFSSGISELRETDDAVTFATRAEDALDQSRIDSRNQACLLND